MSELREEGIEVVALPVTIPAVDSAEVVGYEEAFDRFQGAAVFGDEVRELLLRVMKEFRELGDTVTP